MDGNSGESSPGSPTQAGPQGTPATDSIVLEEEIDPNYVPSEEEGYANNNSTLRLSYLLSSLFINI